MFIRQMTSWPRQTSPCLYQLGFQGLWNTASKSLLSCSLMCSRCICKSTFLKTEGWACSKRMNYLVHLRHAQTSAFAHSWETVWHVHCDPTDPWKRNSVTDRYSSKSQLCKKYRTQRTAHREGEVSKGMGGVRNLLLLLEFSYLLKLF